VFTDVDLSNDSVPAGASAVVLRVIIDASATFAALKVRRNGSTDDLVACTDVAGDSNTGVCDITVGVDSGAVMEAAFTASWTPTTNAGYVVGYYE
jgi:hypothetical protein